MSSRLLRATDYVYEQIFFRCDGYSKKRPKPIRTWGRGRYTVINPVMKVQSYNPVEVQAEKKEQLAALLA